MDSLARYALCLLLLLLWAGSTAAAAAPDLVVAAFDPPSGPVGQTFEISNAVQNAGADPSGSFALGFVLSSDPVFTLEEPAIESRMVRSLDAGVTSAQVNTTVTVPDPVPRGTCNPGMFIDPGNAVAEADEASNVALGPGEVTVTAAVAPDLGTTYFLVTGTGTFKRYLFQGEARNFGTASTGPFSVAYYLSTDPSITLADTLLGVTSFSDLAPGAAVDLRRVWNVPDWIQAGSYHMGAVLDPTDAVAESNEANNTAVNPNPVTIPNLPDLTLSYLALPAGVEARTFVIESSFTNAGLAAAGPFEVEFYLSTDQVIQPEDVLVGTRSHGALEAGATGPLEKTNATVPAPMPGGAYYLGVIIDRANVVSEAIESNNFVYTTTPVTVPPAVAPVPPSALAPTDTDADGLYDDVNGNARADFADVVLYFTQMNWIASNEPLAAFDCNRNGRIDFADVVWLFGRL